MARLGIRQQTPARSGTGELLDASLVEELERSVRGEVRFDAGSRALYSTDASNYRQLPIGVILPRDAEDAAAAIEVCRRHRVPLLPRGGGTSLAGQRCNNAVVLDFSKYSNEIVSLDADRRLARVQPGLVLDDLRNAAEAHHLTFGPDPATHNRNTLGGMIGNNSCGVHSLMAGMTADNVEDLEVLTYRGLRLRVGETSPEQLESILRQGGERAELYRRVVDLRDRYAAQIRARFPAIPRRVSGFNLPALLPENGFDLARALVGSEGTCVTVLEATVRLVHSPPARSLLVLGFDDLYRACDRLPELLAAEPLGLEGFDDRLVRNLERKHLHTDDLERLPAGHGWLLVEFGGEDRNEADGKAQRLLEQLKRGSKAPAAILSSDPAVQEGFWRVRESALGATAIGEHGERFWPGWEDSSAPPERFGHYLRDLRELMARQGFEGAFYGHFGQGCLHTRIDFDLQSRDGTDHFRAFLDEAAEIVLRYGGSLSGEHGDGQARGALLGTMFGGELLQAFREFKLIWDPDNLMNPGKVVDPYSPTENLRLGTSYAPTEPRTFFRFPDDQGSFASAALRCVGVGLCRRHEGGTMCPSYMVTREEEHSTRGRARLLFELLQGDATSGWRDEHVHDALDLCLACKGCKGECPVNVDMASYKAEFLAHHYAGRLRPRSAYAFGWIFWWARLAALSPGLVNLIAGAPFLRNAVKAIAGMAPERRVPRFAPTTFTAWFRRRRAPALQGRRVILWADTFNNHFHPGTARAAVEVLEAAGFRVDVPRQALCCGRPLYDYGWLQQARRQLRQILTALRSDIRAGVPIVGLEPSCVSVFRDELLNLYPHDHDAQRLSGQTFLLGEFLQRFAPEFAPGPLPRRAVVHGHCHHKALLAMNAELDLLKRCGLDCELLDSGCCGMAGAFGFEANHYDISLKVGERVLLPAVRGADPGTLVIADGFSCREQIAQTTRRRALHPAEVLALALRARRAEGT